MPIDGEHPTGDEDFPPPSRRESNKLDKLERIETAARSLFSELGFDNTTTRMIAERADVAAGTVFRYAPSKAALLRQCWREDINRAVDAAVIAGGRLTPMPRWLTEVFGSLVRFYLEDPSLSRVYLREIVFPSPDAEGREADARVTETFLSSLAFDIKRFQRAGEIDASIAPRQVAQLAFTIYLGVLIGALNGAIIPDAVDLLLEQGFTQLLDGCRPAAPPPGGAAAPGDPA